MKTRALNATQQREEETDKQSSNYELVKRTEIKDTPFTVITTQNKSFGVMGKWRLTEDYHNEENAINEMEKMTWNRIIQVIMLISEELNVNKLID